MRLAQDRKGFTLIELLVVIAIIAILAAILFPVFAAARRRAQTAHCLANMNQIGKAITSYINDWQDTYPTNRNTGNALDNQIQLSTLDAKGNPIVGQYGPNWVEGLYAYSEPASINAKDQTHWTCPAASTRPYKSGAGYGGTTYAFNYNMVECGVSSVRFPGNTMLVRELDRRVGADLRPGKLCITNNAADVKDVFLTKFSWVFGYATKPKLHGNGSGILFVDGHVKQFPTSMMPDDANLQWVGTATEGQWWNSNVAGRKIITINP